MRVIKINRLTIENFKCHDRLELLPQGRSISIYGDNATGKTSIYDAFVWLLFGRDSRGNGEKTIDIKPLDESGEVKDHQAITAVEAEFLADGETRTFRRTCRELWVTRRGTPAPVCEGNSFEYFVDGIPVKKSAFDAAVGALVSEELFRMLTSVSHFAAGMKWQERRAVLFDMAGTLTDRQIMEGNPAFAPLLEALGKLTLPELKARLLHRKKSLSGIRDDTPARISECRRTLQDMAELDFAAARAEEQALTRQITDLQQQLCALGQNTALEALELKLRELTLRREQLEGRNRAHRESQRAPGTDPEALRRELTLESSRLESCQTFLENTRQRLARLEAELRSSRSLYSRINEEAFTGGICPTCGQKLPLEQLQEATRQFEIQKEERLAALLEKLRQLEEDRHQSQDQAVAMERELRQRQAHGARLEEALRRSCAVTLRDMEGYGEEKAALDKEIDSLRRQLQGLSLNASPVRQQLSARLKEAEERLRAVQGILAREAIREKTEQRIEALRAEARGAAQALEEIEQLLYLMEEFTRFKARFAQDSINGHFRIASFRLFREQVSGGLEERCDAQYDGVPFLGLNNGMRVNVGIDIINALSRHYGVSVPLFIDNAEAVTRLEDCSAQLIRLVVSEADRTLRVV